ncbi:MAG: succinate dehydrogenase, cytochrome b556 subunit [Sphingomonadaceae bacterium]
MIQSERTKARNLNVPIWPGNFRTGMWAYVLHRITGVVLVAYLLMHIMVISSAMVAGKSAFDALLGILQTPFWVVMDLGLVAVVLFHALNGVRLILFDLGVGVRSQKGLFWLVFLASFAGFVLSLIASLPLIFV